MRRRTFLKRGLLGGAILGVTGLSALSLRKNTPLQRSTAPLVFSPHSFAVLAALAARFVSAPGREGAAIAHAVDTAVSYANRATQKDLERALHLVGNSATSLFMVRRPALFTELDPSKQDALIDAFMNSRILLLRSAMDGLRKLCVASYYADERAARVLGYPGAPFEKPQASQIAPRAQLSPAYIVKTRFDDEKKESP